MNKNKTYRKKCENTKKILSCKRGDKSYMLPIFCDKK